MEKMETKKSKKIVIFVITIMVIAGIADIKYKGKFYQLLPQSVQEFLDEYFLKN